MRFLLLLLAALVAAPSAFAQGNWAYDSDIGGDGMLTPHIHGLVVDPDGKLWYQSYYPFTGDSVAVDPAIVANSSASNCNATTNNCRVSAIHVIDADGTEASFSPLSIVTLPGGEQDTLGGGAILNGSGQRVWDWNSGRGLAMGPDGDVYANIGGATILYRFDYATGAVEDLVRLSELDSRGATSPAVDASGNVFVTGVFPGDPIAIYSPTLDYLGNVDDDDTGFNRTIAVLPDGNTVFNFNYSSKVTTVFQRPDEFSDWDSTGVAFRGMAIESWAIHPTTGEMWVSAGSPNDPPTGRWEGAEHTWFSFNIEDALMNEVPTPVDSIRWNNPGDGRPRAIAFSPDGNTAYVGEFNIASPALQKFVRTNVASERPEIAGAALEQNRPNPFSGRTQIRFTLDDPASVRLTVYDAVGRVVAVLAEGARGSGLHTETFDASSLAGGVYTYVLEIDGQSTARRMLVVR